MVLLTAPPTILLPLVTGAGPPSACFAYPIPLVPLSPKRLPKEPSPPPPTKPNVSAFKPSLNCSRILASNFARFFDCAFLPFSSKNG